MENTFFLKIEILFFFISLFYILYYFWIKLFSFSFKIKKVLKTENINANKTALNKINIVNKSEKVETNATNKQNKLSDSDKQKIADIVKRVKLNSTKWYFDTSKNLIVEWLSIDKFNKDLNLELASIYEKEKNYVNAEYIYKDLLEIYKIDFIVMKKLWYVYALQNKLNDSL